LGQVRKRTYQAPAQLPMLREVAEGWLASKADRRPSTRATWENHVLVHIVPRLGSLRVDQVTVPDVEERLRNALRGRHAPKTANAILTTLTAIFDYAERCGYVERNPARLAERLRTDAAEHGDSEPGAAPASREVDPKDVPSPDEIKRLLLAAEPGLHRTFLLTAALTGARSGELLALTWPDVDFDAGTVHIRRAATWARTREDREAGRKGARYFSPKTRHSHRNVEAPPELVSALKLWKLACPSSSTGLVFPKADGSPCTARRSPTRRCTRRRKRPACAASASTCCATSSRPS
jgi:integrase